MGKIRAFRLFPPGTDLYPHASPVTIEEIELPKMERDTDRPGRFAQGRSVPETAGMSPGENHNEEIEYERRRIKLLATKIVDLVEQEGASSWCLAAPSSINKRIIELIPPPLLELLVTNFTADLTKLPLAEIEHRFLNPSHEP